MQTNIVAFVGKKQGGKTSAARFMAGYVLLKNQKVKGYSINEDGELVVNAYWPNQDGSYEEGLGILDINRTDYLFAEWAAQEIWPLVNIYYFADKLKEIAIDLFGLRPEQVFGTDEEKNSETRITWKSMCAFLPPRVIKKIKDEGKYDRNMTAREFMQYFGTNVCRVLYDDIWVNYTLDKIKYEQSNLAIISDCRFENEMLAVKKAGGKLIKLERRISDDAHASEAEQDDIDPSLYDAIIDNTDMTLEEKNQVVLDTFYSWGLVPG